MRKKAIIDIDNTLWHFCDALYEQLMRINKEFPPPDTWTHWDIWQGYCSIDDFLGAVNAVHLVQDHERHKPYPEAQNFLSSLKKNGYHITIASHRDPTHKKQTEKWLKKHRLLYDDLHLSFHKTHLFDISVDVVVDDSPHVLEKAVESGISASGLLFPWNRGYSDNGVKLFANLNEVLDHILDGKRCHR